MDNLKTEANSTQGQGGTHSLVLRLSLQHGFSVSPSGVMLDAPRFPQQGLEVLLQLALPPLFLGSLLLQPPDLLLKEELPAGSANPPQIRQQGCVGRCWGVAQSHSCIGKGCLKEPQSHLLIGIGVTLECPVHDTQPFEALRLQ